MNFFKETDTGRVKLLFNDFVVRPDKCNFRCRYCLSDEAPDLDGEFGNTDNNNSESLSYTEESKLGKRLNNVMERFNQVFTANILRISGGELFLIKNIEEFLEKRTEYETIQIITNGSLLNENRLERLKKIGRCQLHISLDGIYYSQNCYRVRNEKEHDNLIKNLEKAVEYGFNVEIGSVLTDANTGSYAEFLDYIQKFDGKVKAYPFPIRGEVRNRFYPKKEDIEKYKRILYEYEKYRNVLPPKSFIEETVHIFEEKRKLRCYIPLTMVQLFDNGDLTPCPNSWTVSTGNVLNEDKQTIITRMEQEKMYKLFLQKRPRLECCRSCLTSLDILNLFLNNKISYDEIISIPLYSGEKTKQQILELGNSVR